MVKPRLYSAAAAKPLADNFSSVSPSRAFKIHRSSNYTTATRCHKTSRNRAANYPMNRSRFGPVLAAFNLFFAHSLSPARLSCVLCGRFRDWFRL